MIADNIIILLCRTPTPSLLHLIKPGILHTCIYCDILLKGTYFILIKYITAIWVATKPHDMFQAGFISLYPWCYQVQIWHYLTICFCTEGNIFHLHCFGEYPWVIIIVIGFCNWILWGSSTREHVMRNRLSYFQDGSIVILKTDAAVVTEQYYSLTLSFL